MATVAEAFVTVRPDMDGFGRDLKSGLGRLTKVAGAAALGITAAIGGAAVAGVRKFAELERGMNEVFTLLPDISESAMADMTDQVRDFAVEMGTATEDVVPALYQALSAGVPQDTVFDFLETANKAAIGGITTLETAVNGITSVVNNYGENVVNAAQASDLMFTTVRLGKTDFEQLSASIGNVLPFAAAAGVSFEDISAAMALMTARTGKTAESSTQLRALLVELSDSGTAVGEAFEEAAGDSFKEFIAGGGDMADVMELLQEVAEESGLSIDQLFGSVEAGAGALLLSGTNLETFRENLGEMGEAAGATDAAFSRMDTGLSRAWDRIKVVFDDLLIGLGERIAPKLQEFADWFSENLPGIIDWLERLMDRAGEMGTALSVWWTEDAKPAIDEFVAAVQEHWPTVESIFARLGEIAEDLGRVFGKTFSGMSGDVAEGEESMSSSVGDFLTTLDSLLVATEWVTSMVAGSFNFLAGGATGNFDRMGRGIDDLTGGAYSRFTTRSREVMEKVSAAIHAGIDRVVGFFRAMPERITTAIGDLSRLLTGIGRDIIGGLLGGLREKWEETAGFLSSLGGRIRELKGPIEKDRVLLTDIGEEIIGGLGRGMAREWTAIERQLGIMTAELPAAMAGAPAAARPGAGQMYGDVTIQVSEPLQSTGQDVAHHLRKLAYR